MILMYQHYNNIYLEKEYIGGYNIHGLSTNTD